MVTLTNFLNLMALTYWTTGVVPAVAMGIIAGALGLEDILTQRFA